MSTLSNIHTFVKFDSKTSTASTGQRLCKILFKTPRAGKGIAKQSMCVSIPKLEDTILTEEQTERLIPHIFSLLESAQDGICKNRYEENAISVSSDELSIDACIDYLDADARGDRLTKEFITSWYQSNLADTVMLLIGEKIGATESDPKQDKIDGMVKVYAEKFSALAGGKTMYNVQTATNMLKILDISGVEDKYANQFNRKLNKMIEQQNEMLEAL